MIRSYSSHTAVAKMEVAPHRVQPPDVWVMALCCCLAVLQTEVARVQGQYLYVMSPVEVGPRGLLKVDIGPTITMHFISMIVPHGYATMEAVLIWQEVTPADLRASGISLSDATTTIS